MSETRTNVLSLTPDELTAAVVAMGWEPYRSEQIFKWLWQKDAPDFDSMTDISRERRSRLTELFEVARLQLETRSLAEDGTAKFLFRLADGTAVESVFIPDVDRRTVCVSTQVGCAMGCRFCLTGRSGFRRNLAWHEIAGQVAAVRGATGERPTNVVLMGMGEPFLNYDAVLTALRVINLQDGIGIGARHLTVSTAGIPDRIRDFAALSLQVRLAVSLNAADDETRSTLMPVNRRYPLAELMSAVRDFITARGKRVTFEYVMVANVNDRDRDAENLARLLSGILCKVNLIPLNPFPGLELSAPSSLTVRRFAERLYPRLPAVTIRASHGSSILAGCGQLSGRTLETES